MTDGKMSDKPSDKLRKKLQHRTKVQVQIVREMNANDKTTLYGIRDRKTPSQKRSESMRKKLRNKDGFKCPDDFAEPTPVKEESHECL